MANLEKIRASDAQPAFVKDVIFDTLHTMRTHLNMEIAYLSEFVGDDLVFRVLDAPGLDDLVQVGDTRSLSETYCNHILAGDLPELIPDTSQLPFAVGLPITQNLPIGAHVSVPIERSDGSIYGMFCCLSPHANTSLNQRDLDLMRSFARLAQSEVQRSLEVQSRDDALVALIERTLDLQTFDLVYQPIIDLASGRLTGVEALCRFQSEPYRAPNLWFDDAASVNLAQQLEICVMRKALKILDDLPPGLYLSLNANPETIASGQLVALFAGQTNGRLVLEVTEHIKVSDWAALGRSLLDLRAMGVKIAIDDAGAGYSGLQQMVRLQPDIIKLDRSLVDRIDEDPARRSLCAAMVHYAKETDATLVAEGIEREEEAEVLRALGVERGQGFLLARPMPLADVLAYNVPGQSAASAGFHNARHRSLAPYVLGPRCQDRDAKVARTGEVRIQAHRHILTAPPQITKVVIVTAERVARLPGRDHKHRAVGIGKIVNPAISRAMHVDERLRPRAGRSAPIEGKIPARRGLADVDDP